MKRFQDRVLILAMAGTVCFPGIALAQEAPSPARPATPSNDADRPSAASTVMPDERDDIIVTGSNIVRNGYKAPTPVTAITSDSLTDSNPGRVGDALTALPQFRGSPGPRTAFQSAFGVGVSGLSLRNLGANRTLVLLDGRRIVPNSTRGEYDTDILPQGLIKRVDIVTGGASAQYGADAVGGVVNFVLDKSLVGLRGSIQKGISTYGDGPTFRAELSGGLAFADDRGHFLASYTHTEFGEIGRQDSRPWGRRNNLLVAVSGGNPPNQFFDNVALLATYGGAIVTGPLAGRQFLSGGVVAPFDMGTIRNTTVCVNCGGVSQIQQVTSSLNSDVAYGRLEFKASEAFVPFAEGSYANNRVGFSGLPIYQVGPTAFTIFAGNPYLPADLVRDMASNSVDSFKVNRFFGELGTLNVKTNTDTINLSAGFDGKAGNWSFGASGSYGSNISHVLSSSNYDAEKFYAAVDAVVDPSTGGTVCRVTLTDPGLYPGCVPINLFGQGAPSAAALKYVEADQPYVTRIRQYAAQAYLRGDPFSTWAGPVSIALGADFRRNTLSQVISPLAAKQTTGTGIRGFPASTAGRVGGYALVNAPAGSGSVDVYEGSGEVVVPLAKDVAFAKSLDLNAAARYTHYSTSGSAGTWKVGLTWQPADIIRFRATYSRDIRAPNLGELFLGAAPAQLTITDPKQNNRSYLVFAGGASSPNLKPERAKTYAIGAVLTPRFLPGFSASIDYYNIKVDGVVASLSAQQTIAACTNGSAFNCSLIKRDASSGDIVSIGTPLQNLAVLKTDGIDFDMSYRQSLGSGTIDFRAIASYTPNFITQAAGAAPINRAGEIGAAGVGSLSSNPKLSGTFSITYNGASGFSLFVQERLIGRGIYDVSYVDGVTISNNRIPAIAYTDLTLRQRVAMSGKKQFEFFLTVNNLLNQAPPIFGGGTPLFPSAYNRALYDGVGRSRLCARQADPSDRITKKAMQMTTDARQAWSDPRIPAVQDCVLGPLLDRWADEQPTRCSRSSPTAAAGPIATSGGKRASPPSPSCASASSQATWCCRGCPTDPTRCGCGSGSIISARSTCRSTSPIAARSWRMPSATPVRR